MENMIAFRDAAFWWIGNWALFTGMDAAIAAAVWKLHKRGIQRGDGEPEREAPKRGRAQFFDQDAQPDVRRETDGAEA